MALYGRVPPILGPEFFTVYTVYLLNIGHDEMIQMGHEQLYNRYAHPKGAKTLLRTLSWLQPSSATNCTCLSPHFETLSLVWVGLAGVVTCQIGRF